MRVEWATVVLRRSVLISVDMSDHQLAVEKETVRTDLLGGNCRFRSREDFSGSKVCASSGSGGTPKEDESTRSSSGGPEVAAPAWEVNVRCNLRHRPQIVDEEARCSERKKGPEARCPVILRPVRDVNSDSGCTNGG